MWGSEYFYEKVIKSKADVAALLTFLVLCGLRHISGAGFQMVTPEYYETFGIQLLKGRRFTEQDSATAPRVAIVNETFVRRFLPGVDPLKQRILIEQLVPGQTKLGPPAEWQIVGVSRNIRNAGMRGEGFPVIDVPFQQSPWPGAGVVVRTAGDPAAMSKPVAAAIHSITPDVPLEEIRTMDEIVDESLVNDRFMTALYGSFAGVALLLAAIGIYGVMAFVVAQRSHEIGLRIAFGANPDRILSLVLKEGLALAASGLGLGLIGAFFVGRVLNGLLYGVGSIDSIGSRLPFSLVTFPPAARPESIPWWRCATSNRS